MGAPAGPVGASRGGLGETDLDLVRSLGRATSVGVSNSGLVDPERRDSPAAVRSEGTVTAGNFENAVRWLLVETR